MDSLFSVAQEEPPRSTHTPLKRPSQMWKQPQEQFTSVYAGLDNVRLNYYFSAVTFFLLSLLQCKPFTNEKISKIYILTGPVRTEQRHKHWTGGWLLRGKLHTQNQRQELAEIKKLLQPQKLTLFLYIHSNLYVHYSHGTGQVERDKVTRCGCPRRATTSWPESQRGREMCLVLHKS